MNKTIIHTTPQILEVANYALIRALIITLENTGRLSTEDILQLGAIASNMCSISVNEDPQSSLGAQQLIEQWIESTFA